jgi:thiol-disulfide isomerase/thioredoxin
LTAPATGRRATRALWAAGAVGVVAAVLIAVLARSQPVSQQMPYSPLYGHPAPAITGNLLGGGGRASLAQYKGHFVLVNFMASWCPPCRQEMPSLVAFTRGEAKDDNAVVVGVQYDPTDGASLRSLMATTGARWPIIQDQSATVSYGVNGLPESYLVDPLGLVLEEWDGEVRVPQLELVIARDAKLLAQMAITPTTAAK